MATSRKRYEIFMEDDRADNLFPVSAQLINYVAHFKDIEEAEAYIKEVRIHRGEIPREIITKPRSSSGS